MKLRISEKRLGYLLLLPGIAIILFVGLFPLLFTVYSSFMDYSLFGFRAITFIGAANYIKLVGGRYFIPSLSVTIIYVLAALIAEIILGLSAALLFRGTYKKDIVARVVITYPILMAPVVVGMIWKYLYYPSIGPVTVLLQSLSLPMIDTGSRSTALLSVIIADVWQWTPLLFLIFLSGILAIPNELFEAAELDGMSVLSKFRYIILPNLRAVFTIVLLLRGTLLFSEFDKIFILTRGGPGMATRNLVYSAYEAAFSYYSVGDAATWSIFILIFVNVFVFLSVRVLRRSHS